MEEVFPGHFHSLAVAKAERSLQKEGDVVDPASVAEIERVMRGMDRGIPFPDIARSAIQYEDVQRDVRLCRFLRAAAPGSAEAALLGHLARPQSFPSCATARPSRSRLRSRTFRASHPADRGSENTFGGTA